MSQDWRIFLQDFEERFPREVLHIKEELKREYEPTAIIMELERRKKYSLVHFEKISSSEFGVIANTIATRQRMAMAIGVDERDLPVIYAERIKKEIEPVVLNEAPFKENCMTGKHLDLTKLPIFTHFPIDAGPYITAGLVTAKDPESGADTCGYHRMQLKGPDKLGISLHSRQRLWEYHRRAQKLGKNLEAAVVLGVHPAISLGSMALVPYDKGKFARMGGLLGEPLQITKCTGIDVEVPLWAEIVIEGEILTDKNEPEGPFAEFTNYACHRSTENVFIPKAIYHRTNALYQSITPGMCAEHNTVVAVQREGDVLKALKDNLPNIINVHAPLSACGLFHCYISMKKIAEGQPMQAIMTALSVDHNLKHVVVVDEDVDVFDESRVLWAIATRVQADKDVHIIPQHMGMGCTLDPSTDELSRSAKMGIDATKPLNNFADSIELHPEAMEKAKIILNNI
ncbi:phenolic acid decarboxylase subunit C [Oxobacter pfennigii]|uniref:Phenolic acid decarboxylase subunit C n=1 Tax=Oxobacter pfennigii TaxID=36849 RepID=A0A0P9ADD0_9CLOT|nr:UbiD family decarboxylase [Oxobacter pfennigii]KPU43114.1 phenolic acid decarboxylase subunit C [Oxobacter pfennigii]